MIIKNLSVKRGKHTILKNINLEIKKQDSIIGIFGPNGAGKTTLLSVLAGIINKYEGSIEGLNKENFSFLPDKPYIYKDLKLKNVLSYFDGEYSSFNVQKARRLLKDLGLDENMRIIDCSKGMLEQIHMIMSISREVDYYFFDEPLAAVDPLTRDRLMDIIENEKKPGSIVLISTHLISDVEQLFTDVIMIKNGEIILYDSVKKLKEESGEGLETLFKERLR